ncbi:hypothetical protein [Enterobacter cloacae]|uniref:hypothetical protein n=1 Tax=Enterobacter cloacae TaxID=550 RepID=UPI002FD7D301
MTAGSGTGYWLVQVPPFLQARLRIHYDSVSEFSAPAWANAISIQAIGNFVIAGYGSG